MSKARKLSQVNNSTVTASTISSPKALVFISHDTRDAGLAEAFSALLNNVTCGMLKSFRSSDKSGSQGLEYGSEWYPEIMKQLELSSDVVCLLTEHSLGRPWILYEAGVAKGKLGTPVHGLALGVPLAQAATGPFAQFQNCDGDSESVGKLVTQLAKRLPNADPQKNIVDSQVAEFRKKVEELLKKQNQKPTSSTPEQADESTTVKLFEEVKVMFQELPQRMESHVVRALEPGGRAKYQRNGRMHMDFIMHVLAREVDAATAWLVAISQFREDIPWAYELGMKVYRALDSGRTLEAKRAIEDYRRTIHRLMSTPLGEELMNMRGSGLIFGEMFESLSDRLIDAMLERKHSAKDSKE